MTLVEARACCRIIVGHRRPAPQLLAELAVVVLVVAW
jgi:hypothetical protein